jgi:hypothetical protein
MHDQLDPQAAEQQFFHSLVTGDPGFANYGITAVKTARTQ